MKKNTLWKFVNIHVLLLLIFVLFVGVLLYRFTHFGVSIDQKDVEHDDSGAYLDVLDLNIPFYDEQGNLKRTFDKPTILAFGNAPFADDRDSPDGLANLIAQGSGGTVINCAVSDSYLASQNYIFDADTEPLDAYCFYWLCLLTQDGNRHMYESAEAKLGDALPQGAKEAYETLSRIDLQEVDVIAIMYDATDYLLGHEMYDDANDTNIQQFTGNLEAGIELLHHAYPHIRFIVLSPTYAYAVNEQGKYVSSDMYTYGWDVLSTYVIKEYSSCARQQVTFVDNLYGTITEANADEYLADNLHLNVEGRKKVAERFLKALNYYAQTE